MFYSSNTGGHQYYAKPDQAGDDFDHTDLTTGMVERELDLSDLIPVGTVAVYVWLQAMAVQAGQKMWFYGYDYNGIYISFKANTIVANQGCFFGFWLPVTADRKIKYKIDTASWNWIYVNIVGWLK